MDKDPSGNALVVGQKGPRIYEVIKLLAADFTTITRTEGLNENIRSYPSNHFGLIVMLDSVDLKLDPKTSGELRKLFPEAKLIGIVDRLERDLEIRMRSIGLIFLGTYEYFRPNCSAITRVACSVNARMASA